jgi:hypothetical protein
MIPNTLALMKYIFFIVVLFVSVNWSAGQSPAKAVEDRVETLRKLMVDPEEKGLNEILSADLSYGHSSGRVEDRASFIRSLLSGESDFSSIELKEQSVRITGNVAVVRHQLIGSTNDKGKAPGSVKIGILLVWVNSNGSWTLLARQAFKL